jgi:cell division topological specificity factor MinE
MTFLKNIFGARHSKSPASIGKNRLMVMLETERTDNHRNRRILEKLKADILKVIVRYVGDNDVQIKTKNNNNISIMELKFNLSELGDKTSEIEKVFSSN